jgi:SAM-dependent methyltransferase
VSQVSDTADLARAVRDYWNHRIHDLEMTREPVGTLAFFDDLDAYRFDKLDYLPKIVDFRSFAGKRFLEIGCGIGTDLVRFSRGGAGVIGVDFAETAIRLARENLKLHGLASARLAIADGGELPLPDESVDGVYAHGVLQYAPDPTRIVREARRVLRPGGRAIFMVYNRRSWLNAMSNLMKVSLEHEDAPVLRKYSIDEFRRLLGVFRRVDIVPERFPVKSRLHRGIKAYLYNTVFVGLFNAVPRALVRRSGWHLMAFCEK